MKKKRQRMGILNLPRMLLLAILMGTFLQGSAAAYKITPAEPIFTLTHDFLQPSDVAVGIQGRIYVLDGVRHRVVVFNSEGVFLSSFGRLGSDKGQLRYPLGIAVDNSGTIYIADTGNRRIQVFSPDGDYKAAFAVATDLPSQKCEPVDVAFDEKHKRLYVVDNDNHQIVVYSTDDYAFIGRWGSKGKFSSQFNYPFFTAIADDSSLLVTDVLNTRVQVWSPQGKSVGTIGDWGVDLGQLYRPKGVCSDRANRIYIADSYLGVIQTFNRSGHFKSVVGSRDGTVTKWQTPAGITIDDRQRLYVVEMLANKVSVYQLGDNDIEAKSQ
jgi:DNA-binding beta-propeller fold protein YncE